MIGVVRRSIVTPTREYAAIGPLWAGLEVVGLSLLLNPSISGTLNVSAALCDSGEESEGNFLGGVRLVRGDSLIAGTTDRDWLTMAVAAAGVFPVTLPVVASVVQGSMWVVFGLHASASGNVWVGLVLQPERLVRPSIDRGPAARLPRSNGRVLDGLRAEAAAAQS